MNTTISQPRLGAGSDRNAEQEDRGLVRRYHALNRSSRITWAAEYRKLRLLGKGGQGTVYLSERRGTDLFRVPVALKIFSPELYRDVASYEEDMDRIGAVSSRVALIQHDNLLDLHNFISQDGIRIMVMEWVDGFDLRELLSQRILERTRAKLNAERWKYVQNVILSPGPVQPRLKPGIAIQILRECLAALDALHRDNIVHGDLKPANIMVKRTGNAKIIDIGSALDVAVGGRRMWSPLYAAPEVLRGGPNTPQTDLASLGYVLVEMLAGVNPFEGIGKLDDLLEAKLGLEKRLSEILPAGVRGNELLSHLCQRLITPDPVRRFPNAQAALLDHKGAADFHRQLVKVDLASEYENDLRSWLEELD